MLLLLACTTAPREVAVVESATNAVPDAPTRDTSPADTGSWVDTGVTSVAAAVPVRATCGDPALDALPTGDDVLTLDWCTRVSPEAAIVEGADTAAPAGPPPPCGFANLVGALDVQGPAAEPLLLYCDTDRDGGVRLVRAGGDGATGTLLEPLDCEAAQYTGALRVEGDGALVAWSGFASGSRDTPDTTGLLLARVDGDGTMVEGPERTTLEGAGTWKLSFVEGAPDTMLVNDYAGALWRLTLDGATVVEAVPLAEDVGDASALAVGDELFVATCGLSDTTMRLSRVVDGALVPTAVTGACGWDTRPVLATDGAHVAVAWDEDQSHVVILDAAREVVATHDFPDAWAPHIAWDGTDFVVLTTDGAVQRITPDGALGATWWHPAFLALTGSAVGTRLRFVDGVAQFVLMGMDAEPIGGGHVVNYNYLELSAAPWP